MLFLTKTHSGSSDSRIQQRKTGDVQLDTHARSPMLMNRDDSALLIVDVQERLVPHIAGHERIVWNIVRLLKGADALGVKAFATEQYPKGLGYTVSELREYIETNIPEKTMFSCRECGELLDAFADSGIQNVVIVGIEAHVCVAQTALDFISAGLSVFICIDAVGSRFNIDRDTAFRRLEYQGAIPTTTEAVLFEWCEKAGSPEFKTISKLAQEMRPS